MGSSLLMDAASFRRARRVPDSRGIRGQGTRREALRGVGFRVMGREVGDTERPPKNEKKARRGAGLGGLHFF